MDLAVALWVARRADLRTKAHFGIVVQHIVEDAPAVGPGSSTAAIERVSDLALPYGGTA